MLVCAGVYQCEHLFFFSTVLNIARANRCSDSTSLASPVSHPLTLHVHEHHHFCLLFVCDCTMYNQYGGWSVVLFWRHFVRFSGFQVETHVRLQHLLRDWTRTQSCWLVPRRRPLADVVLRQTSVTLHWKISNQPRHGSISVKKSIMEISPDTISTNVDHLKERQRRPFQ